MGNLSLHIKYLLLLRSNTYKKSILKEFSALHGEEQFPKEILSHWQDASGKTDLWFEGRKRTVSRSYIVCF